MFSPQDETLSESKKTQRACPFPPCLTACSLRRRVLLRGTEQVAWGLATPGSLEHTTSYLSFRPSAWS